MYFLIFVALFILASCAKKPDLKPPPTDSTAVSTRTDTSAEVKDPYSGIEIDPNPIIRNEDIPRLIGGSQAILDYINQHHLYPKKAQEAGIDGAALIYFTVGADGSTKDFMLEKEKPEGYGFGQAALEVMKQMKFTPGIRYGKYVDVRMQHIVKFKIK